MKTNNTRKLGDKLQDITALVAVETDILKLQEMCLRVAAQGKNVLYVDGDIHKIFPSTFAPNDDSIWDWCRENDIMVQGGSDGEGDSKYSFWWGKRR